MCPPVVVRKSREGMAYLYASWLYELKHGSQLEVCFTCFKIAFMDLKDMLESEDWEDEEWDPMELDEAEHEQAENLGPEPGWEPWALVPTSVEIEEEYLDDSMVPIELEPQSAVPLGPGPEHADWTQALPWRFNGLPACNHWPSPPSPKPVFPRVTLSPVEPMVLELGTMWPVEPAEAKAWLLDLQVFCVVGYQDTTIYLRKMTPTQALRSLGQRWRVLLEPAEVWMLKLQESAEPPYDLLRCQLSILEKTQHSEQLLPARTILQQKGFTIVSYSACSVNEGHSASASWFPTSGQDPGPLETGSRVPRGPGESLAVTGVLALGELSCFQPFHPELENRGAEPQAVSHHCPGHSRRPGTGPGRPLSLLSSRGSRRQGWRASAGGVWSSLGPGIGPAGAGGGG
ncbi:testis-expressed protein 19.2-like [Heterocephalus glaber]|uniref:Testis-expressed protein 19.2-like n=1 Tax=Heterocephalus glaber TaxID=10181 RepID=A0AAX6PXH0_HETGA|nr:testis-expressed protein 19.2-like [Heterocephalus glaber]